MAAEDDTGLSRRSSQHGHSSIDDIDQRNEGLVYPKQSRTRAIRLLAPVPLGRYDSRAVALRVILIVLGALVLFQILLRSVRKLYHFPAPAFIGRLLDSRLRRVLQPPHTIIARSGIRPGLNVLELGCGSGAFTPFVARALGEKGTLHALDIQPAMLAQLKRKLSATRFGDIRNVVPTLGSAYELPFADESLDLVYLVTVFQEIPDKRRALAEAKRVLRQDGILAITEFLVDPDYPFKRTTVRQVTDAGFTLSAVEGGIWSYTTRFRKP